MRSNAEYARALALVAAGLNDCRVAQATGVPRSTIRDWRRRRTGRPRIDARHRCPDCGHPEHRWDDLPRGSYAYLLGMYLGDGDITRSKTWRLRITLDMKWRGIIAECVEAMQTVLPENRVSLFHQNPAARCLVASVYSKQLLCLFPQHGAGPKHLRRIELDQWQQAIVFEESRRFLRGLIHSDGCRFTNRVRVNGKTYEYPRYNFTSASADIRGLFTEACDQLGVEWRRMNARNISVARRAAVTRLDEFVGPKY